MVCVLTGADAAGRLAVDHLRDGADQSHVCRRVFGGAVYGEHSAAFGQRALRPGGAGCELRRLLVVGLHIGRGGGELYGRGWVGVRSDECGGDGLVAGAALRIWAHGVVGADGEGGTEPDGGGDGGG